MSGTQPKHQNTWNDCQERILRVLTHIQEHLDETLDLEELARVACFSSFHFHRVFAAMTGETIADHVRRLRLERAAMELRSGAKQVIQVALDAGYEAHAAFTRAFKAAYGVSPAEFRRATGPIAIRDAPSGVHFRPGVPVTRFNTNHSTTKVMKVITRKIKPMRVAYLRHVGPYEKRQVAHMGFDLLARLSADKQVRQRSAFICIGHDNPSVTPASELRFDTCFTVDEKYEPKKPVELQTIGGGDYAQDRIVPDCIRSLQRGEAIPIRNKTATRPWQHVLEPLSGYLWLAARLAREGKTSPLVSAFNFGPDAASQQPVRNLVESVLREWPGEWKDASDPRQPHEAKLLTLSIKKAAEMLDWHPVWSFPEAVSRTVVWYRNRHQIGNADMLAFSVSQIEHYAEAARQKKAPWAQ